MSVPPLEAWFSSSIRRNRKSFMLAMLGVLAVILGSYLGVRFFAKTSAGGTVWLAFLVPAVICTYFLTAQRLRDLNFTGWLALLWIPIGVVDKSLGGWLTPVTLLLLCAVPGTKGANRYGTDPLAPDLARVFD